MTQWEEAERIAGRPVAATLEDCARLLGVPLAVVTEAAEHVEPYQHKDGSPRWSVTLIEMRLWPQRFGRHTSGTHTRKRRRAG